MRWLVLVAIASAFLLVGWTAGQKAQSEDVMQKVESLEKRLAEAERKIAELEKKVADLRKQVAQVSPTQRFFTVPAPSLELLLGLQIPERRLGFGLPQPAPFPFVQPYYYPLGKQP
ncbi:MAG: hypothetical protein N2116_05610 [Armatimonadetes bacterium]|nr:hypothetical protein [Armatimonadota bacterium]